MAPVKTRLPEGASGAAIKQRLFDAIEQVLTGDTSRTDITLTLSDKRKARFIVYRLNDIVPVRVDFKVG